jgi:hypothetical protein
MGNAQTPTDASQKIAERARICLARARLNLEKIAKSP